MYTNYSTKLKLVIIALVLITSISISLNTSSTSQIIGKLAFAQQNSVLPNYSGNYRAIEPSNTVDNKANPAFSEIQTDSLVHYQPITPTSHYYTGIPNEPRINSFPISTANMINSTNTSGIVQPVSLVNYQPIAPAASQNPITSTTSAGLEHASTDNGDHHSSNDNSHDGGSHSSNTHHKSSSTNDNNDHGGRTKSHHGSHHFGTHRHGASASASAGSGGASASASAG